MDHVVSINLKDNQVNGIVDNTLKFDSKSSVAILIRYPQPVVTIGIILGKKSRKMINYGLIYLWDSGVFDSTIKMIVIYH